MASFNPSNASITIFTYKEGLLSKVAHDLQIAVCDFSIDASSESISARIDARSLRVEHCMRQGTPAPGVLSASDKKKIEANIVKDVLHTRRFPVITFSADEIVERGEALTIKGSLSLHGTQRNLNITARRQGGRFIAEFWIHQQDFGITPYKALMGAIKLKSDLKVVVSTPVDL